MYALPFVSSDRAYQGDDEQTQPTHRGRARPCAERPEPVARLYRMRRWSMLNGVMDEPSRVRGIACMAPCERMPIYLSTVQVAFMLDAAVAPFFPTRGRYTLVGTPGPDPSAFPQPPLRKKNWAI